MVMKTWLVLSNSLFLKNFFRVYIKVTNIWGCSSQGVINDKKTVDLMYEAMRIASFLSREVL